VSPWSPPGSCLRKARLFVVPRWHQPWLDRAKRRQAQVRWRKRGGACPTGAHPDRRLCRGTHSEQFENRDCGPMHHAAGCR